MILSNIFLCFFCRFPALSTSHLFPQRLLCFAHWDMLNWWHGVTSPDASDLPLFQTSHKLPWQICAWAEVAGTCEGHSPSSRQLDLPKRSHPTPERFVEPLHTNTCWCVASCVKVELHSLRPRYREGHLRPSCSQLLELLPTQFRREGRYQALSQWLHLATDLGFWGCCPFFEPCLLPSGYD